MAKMQAVNPFKPGAGHVPPYLAGRDAEQAQFRKLLQQQVVAQNLVLTGLRGVGKTVLVDGVYKPMAAAAGWVWVGSDFSEGAFVDEKALCQRLFTDLSLFTATLTAGTRGTPFGFQKSAPPQQWNLDFPFLESFCESQPGLQVDKLKCTLEFAWRQIQATGKRGVVFAYDESQVVQDRRDKDQYPLAMLLETFQSLQRKDVRFLLVLSGLPTLFPKLVESRTYAERMFTVQEIGRLRPEACREAIVKPLAGNPIPFTPQAVDAIVDVSSCYPYFVQFMGREAYDFVKAHYDINRKPQPMPLDTLVRKLDADFFAGRWNRLPDRQRELLACIAARKGDDPEFTVTQIVAASQKIAKPNGFKPFKAGDVNAMLPKLIDTGILYRSRHGRYLLALPLFDAFIRRQFESPKAARPMLSRLVQGASTKSGKRR